MAIVNQLLVIYFNTVANTPEQSLFTCKYFTKPYSFLSVTNTILLLKLKRNVYTLMTNCNFIGVECVQ